MEHTSDSPQKLALVTGASRGLGFATALALAERGVHVIALARTAGGLDELADKIDAFGGSSTLVPLDITDEPGLARMGRAIHDRWGHLDLLVHAAAHASPLSPAAMASAKDLDKAMDINAKATQRLIFMCDPLLQAAQAPQAVCVTDPKARGKFFAAYGASKAAAEAIAAAWAAENAALKLKVHLFMPDPMPSALRARFYPGENRETLSPAVDQAARLLSLLDL